MKGFLLLLTGIMIGWYVFQNYDIRIAARQPYQYAPEQAYCGDVFGYHLCLWPQTGQSR
jgi:hypothetical protein